MNGVELTPEQLTVNPGLAAILDNILARYSPKIETCRIVYPTFDLGHEVKGDIGGPFKAAPYLVYATIYRNGRESCRVTRMAAWWREGE